MTSQLWRLAWLQILDSALADYWDDQCTACPASLYSSQHCNKGGTLLGERGCGALNIFCEGHCSDPDSSPNPQPENRYWDGQCKPCPADLYQSEHCQEGGVLVGSRPCGTANLYCEGECTKPQDTGAPAPTFYWDGQCTACPARFYSSKHCLEGGDLVGERACGPTGALCEGKCRAPQSSPAPSPTLYWDGQCTPCPSQLYDHCSKGGKLVGERGCGFLNIYCEGRFELPAEVPEPADWIIVGAGASGCTAAAALADEGEDVLVLERGKSDLDSPETQQADTWPAVVNSDATQTIRWEDGTWGAVAQVLGGGTEINGGLYIEEEPDFLQDMFGDDFDLEAFYASSKWVAQNLTTPLQPSTYGDEYAAALSDIGVGAPKPKPELRMSSNSSWVAYSTINTTASGWPRRGAAVLLHERSGMKNLRFFTHFQVMRVNFDGTRSTGVSVKTPAGRTVNIEARKGVILAAGAIFTPQLLQVSGIGDQSLLGDLGVETVAENPAVGQNFVDRNVLSFGVWASQVMPLFIGYAMASNSSLGLTLESEGWGQVASAFALASLALVEPSQRTETLRDFLKPLLAGPIADIMNSMIQLVALHHQTYSRGTVVAKSTDASEAPEVTANYFQDERDLENQYKAMEALFKIVESESVQKLVNPSKFKGTSKVVPVYLSCLGNEGSRDAKAVVLPCLPPDGSDKERYFEYFRNTVVSSYHYFGTAAHGSVVEGADFKVKGTDNLHVVDASVFPDPTRVNPQGTIMAMGHYIASRLANQKTRRLHSEVHI